MFSGLGEALGTARQMRYMTLETLAGKTGIPPKMLSDYEKGRSLPALPVLGKLLAALEMSPFSFFCTLHFLGLESQPLDGPAWETALGPELDEGFRRIFHSLLSLQKQVFAHERAHG